MRSQFGTEIFLDIFTFFVFYGVQACMCLLPYIKSTNSWGLDSFLVAVVMVVVGRRLGVRFIKSELELS